jgi:FkbM family methyltransferase
MKNLAKYILQTILGYRTYLFVFAKFKIRNIEKDKKEKDFFAFLDEIKGEGDLLDVGANIGIMTYHMSKRFPQRKTLAIEPMPSNIEVLMRIIEKFNLENVDLIPMAVGDKEDEEIKMILPRQGKVKLQGLSHVKHDSITEWNEGEEYTVLSSTLDKLLAEHTIAGIKMDIENYEFFALKGAQTLLERDKPLVYLELWENENRDKCFEFLNSLGYKAFIASDSGLLEFDDSIKNKQNFIFKA